jgi:hypothetical protein
MGAGLMSLSAVKSLLKNMTDKHGEAFSLPDSKHKMRVLSPCTQKIQFANGSLHHLLQT